MMVRIGAGLLFFAVAVALRYAAGAFDAEFSAYPDEPAHFLTGLMVRDYLAGGLGTHPMRFAESYYAHYPRTALGHWPPVFYLVQAAWMLVFAPGRVSVLLLIAVLTAGLAEAIFSFLRREFGILTGLSAGLFFVLLPLTQQLTGAVMAEMLTALLSFHAVLVFGDYLESGRPTHSIWFGALAALAILTKPNALALAIVPLLAVMISRRYSLFGRTSFWMPAAIVVVTCGPWYWWARGMAHSGLQIGFTKGWLRKAVLLYNSAALGELAGWPILGIALIGMAARWGVSGRWAAMCALLPSVWIFHTAVVPLREVRHFVPAIPAVVVFAAVGIHWLCARWRWAGAAGAVACAAFFASSFTIPRKPHLGIRETVGNLPALSGYRDAVILVSGGPATEGALIAEIAMNERRPGHFVLRGSKVLARLDLMGRSPQLLYHSPEDVLRFLESVPVGLIVHDGDARILHVGALAAAIRQFPACFVGVPSASPTLSVYEVKECGSRQRRPVRLDLTRTLGRFIEAAN
jgi:4-amino-4-deoxy-L-arabinose transferase-like glycosyltransferase